MSSSYKTNNLKLNSWVGSDIPIMQDFNNDNEILDNTISNHTSNSVIHITDDERNKWNKPFALTSYVGDGKTNQAVALNVGFNPSFCIVMSANITPSVVDIANSVDYNYFGIATIGGSMAGLQINGSTLTVTSSAIAIAKYEMRSYNEIGRNYLVIAFR